MASENCQTIGRVVDVQVSGLVGAALNWSVFCAIYKGMQPTINVVEASSHKMPGAAKAMQFPRSVSLSYTGAYGVECRWNPQGDWDEGGPLIDRFGIEFEWITDATLRAEIPTCGTSSFASNHLIAACRAIVAAHLGEVVSVPAELISPDAK